MTGEEALERAKAFVAASADRLPGHALDASAATPCRLLRLLGPLVLADCLSSG